MLLIHRLFFDHFKHIFSPQWWHRGRQQKERLIIWREIVDRCHHLKKNYCISTIIRQIFTKLSWKWWQCDRQRMSYQLILKMEVKVTVYKNQYISAIIRPILTRPVCIVHCSQPTGAITPPRRPYKDLKRYIWSSWCKESNHSGCPWPLGGVRYDRPFRPHQQTRTHTLGFGGLALEWSRFYLGFV